MLVRNLLMSVDPYMRGRMNDVAVLRPAVPARQGARRRRGRRGRSPRGPTASRRASSSSTTAAGASTRSSTPSTRAASTPRSRRRRRSSACSACTGLTAYAGLLDVAALREGDVVFVSGAAGAVGSIAGQIAKLRGHTVIGSAGSAEKVALLLGELGFDAAFDYHDGRSSKLLRAAAPDGIDLYFDNVGGEHLEAAIGALRRYGRIALCGAISSYNATEPPAGPRNMHLAIGKRLTMRGFIVFDHDDRRPDVRARGRRLAARGPRCTCPRRSSRAASSRRRRPSSTCSAEPTRARCWYV